MCDGEPLPCFFPVEWKSLISGRVERALDSGLGLLFVSPGKLLLTPSSTNGHWTASVHLPLVGEGYPVSQKKKKKRKTVATWERKVESRWRTATIYQGVVPSIFYVGRWYESIMITRRWLFPNLVNQWFVKRSVHTHTHTGKDAWKTVAPRWIRFNPHW